MSTIHFAAKVQQINDRTVVRIPALASAELPSRGQVAVTGIINGQEFATVVEPDGMKGHWISIDERFPETVGVTDGEKVRVEMLVTKSWPEPQIPEDLRAALEAAPDLEETWLDITPMARWEWVRWIQATKNPDTRARRVAVSISKLRDGKRRPCCFDLSSCTDPELSKSGKLIAH